jgi:hypothetical protein
MEQEKLATLIKSQRSLGLKGANWDNYALGLTQVEEELSSRGADSLSSKYTFDERLRDALLTNIRQDGIHALANTVSIVKAVRYLEIQVIINFWLIVAALVLIFIR